MITYELKLMSVDNGWNKVPLPAMAVHVWLMQKLSTAKMTTTGKGTQAIHGTAIRRSMGLTSLEAIATIRRMDSSVFRADFFIVAALDSLAIWAA